MDQWIIVTFLLYLIGLVQPTTIPLFGNIKLSSTTPYSHISSYLNQRRSDSRAEKSDEFPNFDFEFPSSTTKRPVTRVQVYKHVVGKVVEDIRDRVTNAIVQGQMDKQNLRKLENIQEEKDDNNHTKDSITTTTEFIGLTLNEDELNVTFETSNNPSTEKPEIERPFPGEPNNFYPGGNGNYKSNFLAAKFKNKTRALATIIFTPLLGAWTTVQQNLHIPSITGTTTTTTTSTEVNNNNNNLQQQDNIEKQKHPTTGITGAAEAGEQQSSGIVQTWINNGIQRNLRRAPFRNAFYKYSNLVEKGSYNESVDNPFASTPVPHKDSTEIEVNVDKDGLDDDEDKLFDFRENQNQNNNNSNNNNKESVISSVRGGRLMFNEGLGIYVLEIIGTIAGLTWGAITQIQNIFGNQQ